MSGVVHVLRWSRGELVATSARAGLCGAGAPLGRYISGVRAAGRKAANDRLRGTTSAIDITSKMRGPRVVID